jgi:hypothetical protein
MLGPVGDRAPQTLLASDFGPRSPAQVANALGSSVDPGHIMRGPILQRDYRLDDTSRVYFCSNRLTD